jgi:putative transposase
LFTLSEKEMKKSRFSEEQIIGILAEQESGIKVSEVCGKHGMSDPTFYKWKSKFGGMDVSDAKRLKSLETENTELKKMVAELSLDKRALEAVLRKKY